jgi:hypothetical protein
MFSIGCDLQRFKFMAAKLSIQPTTMASTHRASFNPADSVNDQLTTYFSLVQSWQKLSSAEDSLSITAGIIAVQLFLGLCCFGSNTAALI